MSAFTVPLSQLQDDDPQQQTSTVPPNTAAPVGFAKPGPYVTNLGPEEEKAYNYWVKQNKIPWRNSPTSDYDRRGYWKAQQAGDPSAKQSANRHFPDTWKTPYHASFSNESMYALPGAPHWEGQQLVPTVPKPLDPKELQDQTSTVPLSSLSDAPPSENGTLSLAGTSLRRSVSKIGDLVQQGLQSDTAGTLLQAGQKYLVDPLNKMAESGAQVGRNIGSEVVQGATLLSHPGNLNAYVPHPGLMPPIETSEQQAIEEHPIAMGVAQGVGSVAGGAVADLRNWPFMASGAARPLLQRLIAGGFGAQMGSAALSTAKELYQNWDRLSPQQRAELITTGGLSALMSAASIAHAASGGGDLEAQPDVQPQKVPLSQLSDVAEPAVTPGPGAQNLNTGVKESGADIAQLGTALRASTSPKQSIADRLDIGDQIANQASQGQDAISSGLTKLKTATAALWDAYARPEPWTDFKDARGKWDAALQKSSYEGMQFAKNIKDGIPDDLTREAITNYVQAGGDIDLLNRRAAASSPELADGYRAAASLGPDERIKAQNVANYFDAKLQQASDSGMLSSGVENYVTQVWDRPNPVTQKLQADIDYSNLRTDPNFIRKRVFDSYFEGEQAGYKPKNKDIGFLVTAYDEAFNKAAASRAFIRSLLEGKAKDGRPLVAPNADSFGTIANPEGNVEAYVIRPKLLGDKFAGYRPIDHPALRKWTWIGKDEAGNPIYQRGDLWVHPEAWKELKNNLSTSALRQYTAKIGDVEFQPGRAVLNVSQKIKGTMLGYSAFHQVQEGYHALGHWVNPFKASGTIDLENPTQMALIEHDLQISNARAQEEFLDGHSQAYGYKVPVIGRMAQKYSDWLFHVFIPNLKMKTALHMLERNQKRFAGKYTLDEILETSAKQANAAYGELNYHALGRSKTMQDAFRLLALAPDFLEARARFVAQAFRPDGTEQRIALVRSAAMLYGAARVVNAMLNNGNTHPEKPFAVTYNGKDYFLRSVVGDAEHLITDWRSFVYYRLNPVTAKPAIEALFGRDEFGRPRTMWQHLQDTVKGWSPIAIQKWVKNPQSFSLFDSLLQSVGVANTRSYSAGAKAAHDYVMTTIPDSAWNSPSTAKMRDLESKVASGALKPADIHLMAARGELTAPQVSRIVGQESKLSDVQRDFKRLPIEKAVELFPQYSPDEQSDVLPILARKGAGIADLNRPIDQKRALAQTVRGILQAQRQRGVLKLKK